VNRGPHPKSHLLAGARRGARPPRPVKMPLVSEQIHPRGLSFAMQRKVVILRDIHKEPWPSVADQVRNLKNERPGVRTVQRYYKTLSRRSGRVHTKYENCGLKPHKVTKAIETFLVQRLRHLRTKMECTSRTLQHEVARAHRTTLSVTWVRRLLAKKGYRWLPKRQKRKYNAAAKKARVAFAKKVLAMGVADVHRRLSLAMDGVVLTMPPGNPTERMNFCQQGDDKMWRKPNESLSPALAGGDQYSKQVPLGRAVSLWGGCSAKGFAPVVFHKTKKLTVAEWVKGVDGGRLGAALKAVRSQKVDGRWLVLCDNESFLRAAAVGAAHKKIGVKLLKIPAKSPDLNPVERFWAWLRKKLRAMDLADATKKRPVLTKAKYTARVKRLLKTKKAQQVAGACARGLRKVCREVVRNHGAATHG